MLYGKERIGRRGTRDIGGRWKDRSWEVNEGGEERGAKEKVMKKKTVIQRNILLDELHRPCYIHLLYILSIFCMAQ